MSAKPTNHVTRAQAKLKAGTEVPLPLLDNETIERLEAVFPPRCIARNETIEDHLRYAGVVEHVQALRSRFTVAQPDDSDEDDLSSAERIR